MNELAQMLWAEARGEGVRGMRAVAHVAFNRVKDPRWSDDLREVLTQPNQFVLKQGRGPHWERVKRLAQELIENPGEDPTNGALFFATYTAWPNMRRHGRIGGHLFFSR